MFGNRALQGQTQWGGAVTSNLLGGRCGLSPEVLSWEPLKDLKQMEGHN